MNRTRCAIYTRKSSEDGLQQEFNSLDAQREACAAFITSQKAEGWRLLPGHYDDGGISGGTMARPALKRLLTDIDEGRVDQIVVYKIDRLTRSLADFAKIVDRLDATGASFVSVTQSFNTATSMGRLTLNMLLSFAQFEREVTAERIRDKIAASKKKGLWMGGSVPMGYQPDGRTLVIDESEANTIRRLYSLYLEHGSIREVKESADKLRLRSRKRTRNDGRVTGESPFSRGHIHHILANPIYAGRIRHKDKIYDGLHPAIVKSKIWDEVQDKLKASSAKLRGSTSKATTSPLAGKLFDETGDRMTPSHSSKNGKRLRYYISRRLVTDRSQKHPEAWRLPAPQLEMAIETAIQAHISGHGSIARIVQNLKTYEVESFSERLQTPFDDSGTQKSCLLALVAEVRIAPGELKIALSGTALAAKLEIPTARLIRDCLFITSPFQLRRKGVETKIIIGDTRPEHNRTLIRNIVKARKWYSDICKGTSFADIADRDGVSKRRVQDLVDLAFLSPTLIQQIAAGTQPNHLNTDALIKSGFPVLWADQVRLFGKDDATRVII